MSHQGNCDGPHSTRDGRAPAGQEAMRSRGSRAQRQRRWRLGCRWAPWLLPIVGLSSLLWFLFRVVPKPSRAAYPCQRVAFPLASSFVLWLAGLAGSTLALRRARYHFTQARLIAGVVCLGISIGAVWLLVTPTDRTVYAQTLPVPNVPLG